MEKEEVLIKIGKRIRELRQDRNMNQQNLAASCNFEKSNMSRIESGRNNLTIGTLLKICNALNVKLADVLDVD